MFRKWRARLRFGPIWRPRVMTVRWTWTKQLWLNSNDKVRQRKSRSQKEDLPFLCRSPNTGINFRFPSLWLPLNVFKKRLEKVWAEAFPHLWVLCHFWLQTYLNNSLSPIPSKFIPPANLHHFVFTQLPVLSMGFRQVRCRLRFTTINHNLFIITRCDSVVFLIVSSRLIRKFSWLLPIIS